MKAKQIICHETGEKFNSLMATAQFLQSSPKHRGKKYDGTKIAGKPIYRRLSMHLNGVPFMHKGEKEYFVKSIFGYSFSFVENN